MAEDSEAKSSLQYRGGLGGNDDARKKNARMIHILDYKDQAHYTLV